MHADSANLVLLRGELSRAPSERELPSGSRLINYEVTTRSVRGGRAETVPVSWFDAPASAADLEPRAEVVVLGRVVRRFFRLGTGATGSRTEVVADRVVPARQGRRVGQLLARARRELGD